MSKFITWVLAAVTLAVGVLTFGSAPTSAAGVSARPSIVERTAQHDIAAQFDAPIPVAAKAATTPQHTTSAQALTARPAGISNFWAYVRCVTGIGVPAGVAIFIATAMPVWLIGYLASGRIDANRLAYSLGFGAIVKYATAVGRSCMQFIRS